MNRICVCIFTYIFGLDNVMIRCLSLLFFESFNRRINLDLMPKAVRWFWLTFSADGHNEAEFGMSWCASFGGAFYNAYFEVFLFPWSHLQDVLRFFLLFVGWIFLHTILFTILLVIRALNFRCFDQPGYA